MTVPQAARTTASSGATHSGRLFLLELSGDRIRSMRARSRIASQTMETNVGNLSVNRWPMKVDARLKTRGESMRRKPANKESDQPSSKTFTAGAVHST